MRKSRISGKSNVTDDWMPSRTALSPEDFQPHKITREMAAQRRTVPDEQQGCDIDEIKFT